MSKSKTTRHALFASATALLLCVVMLIGTTFAWFTDTASTGVNSIQSGTLDVVLEMKDGENWVDAKDKTLEFVKADGTPEGEQILWEPGCTYNLPELRIRNNGNLALKYKIDISKIFGDNELKDAIDWTVKVGGEEATLAAYVGNLTAGSSAALTISGHMKETAGNEYQGKSIDGVAITVLATQDTVEYDSNNNTYDSGAEYPWDGSAATAEELAKATDDETKTVTIATPELLAAFADNVSGGTSYDDYTVSLANNIDLNNMAWTPIGTAEAPFSGTFNGNGNSVAGLNSELFGYVSNAEVKDLNVEINSKTGGLIADAAGTNQITDVTVNGKIDGNTANIKNAAFILETKSDSVTTLTNCTNNASVTNPVESATGFIGSAYGTVNFNNCVNNGSISSTKATGGAKASGYIVTVRPNAVINMANCENNGDIYVEGIADVYGAGFIDWDGSKGATVTLTNCTNNANITGLRTGGGSSTIALGGIIAVSWNAHTTTLTGAVNNGTISATNNASDHNAHVGGIVGLVNPSAVVVIDDANSNGALSCTVNNTAGTPNVGGLVGQINNGTLTVNSAAITENVTATTAVADGSTKTSNVDAVVGNVTGNATVTVNSLTNKSSLPCRYTATA